MKRKPMSFIPRSFLPEHYKELKDHKFRDVEVAELLDVTPNTLQTWKRVHRLTGIMVPRSDYVDKAIPDTFTLDTYKELKKLNMTDVQICDEVLYCSPRVIHEWKKKKGIIRQVGQIRPTTIQDEAAVVRAHQSGVSQRTLAKRYGVGRTTIWRIIKKHKEGAYAEA